MNMETNSQLNQGELKKKWNFFEDRYNKDYIITVKSDFTRNDKAKDKWNQIVGECMIATQSKTHLLKKFQFIKGTEDRPQWNKPLKMNLICWWWW